MSKMQFLDGLCLLYDVHSVDGVWLLNDIQGFGVGKSTCWKMGRHCKSEVRSLFSVLWSKMEYGR